MSAVIAVPELMDQAATDLAAIGDTLNAAHLTAAAPTVAVLPAAADEVSTGISQLFSGYGQEYQKLAGQAAAFSDHFVQNLTQSAASYASAEAANVASLRPLNAAEGLQSAELFLEGLPALLEDIRPILGIALLLLFLGGGGLLGFLLLSPFYIPYYLADILATFGI